MLVTSPDSFATNPNKGQISAGEKIYIDITFDSRRGKRLED